MVTDDCNTDEVSKTYGDCTAAREIDIGSN